jgi:hypothetical protein
MHGHSFFLQQIIKVVVAGVAESNNINFIVCVWGGGEWGEKFFLFRNLGERSENGKVCSEYYRILTVNNNNTFAVKLVTVSKNNNTN